MTHPKKPTLSQDWPQLERDSLDRYHAVYAVVDSLEQLDLGAWVGRCLSFLGQYDGLAFHFDGGQDPALQLRSILSTYVWSGFTAANRLSQPLRMRQRHALTLLQRIVQDILALEFVTYRARVSPCYGQPGRDWNPATQPWLAFIDSLTSEEGYLQVWRSENTQYLQTHMQAIRSYLLAPVTDLPLAAAPPSVLGSTA